MAQLLFESYNLPETTLSCFIVNTVVNLTSRSQFKRRVVQPHLYDAATLPIDDCSLPIAVLSEHSDNREHNQALELHF